MHHTYMHTYTHTYTHLCLGDISLCQTSHFVLWLNTCADSRDTQYLVPQCVKIHTIISKIDCKLLCIPMVLSKRLRYMSKTDSIGENVPIILRMYDTECHTIVKGSNTLNCTQHLLSPPKCAFLHLK